MERATACFSNGRSFNHSRYSWFTFPLLDPKTYLAPYQATPEKAALSFHQVCHHDALRPSAPRPLGERAGRKSQEP